VASPQHASYVYYGKDEPRLKDALDAFLAEWSDPAMADLNLTRLDGTSIQLGDIESMAGALPFLSDTRVVLVEDLSGANNGKEIIEALPDVLAALPDSTRLVFVETGLNASAESSSAQKRLKSRQSVLKKLINVVEADSRGKIEAFDMPKNPTGWIEDRAAHYGADIMPAAARELAERIGENLVLADMEIVKLATYAGSNRPIAVEDVQELTPYTPDANIFYMVDAMGQRRGDVALRLLRQLIEDGDEPLRLYGMIVRQYRLLLLLKEQLDAGQTVRSAAKTLDLHPYVAEKLGAQVRNYSLATLERIYRYLLEFDLAMKGQSVQPIDGERDPLRNMEPALALETLITLLAGKG
jgi:DNA polymerase III subunit delta